ncbi:putative lipid-transfer protein DIR1 [Punica granatum]|uniref:Bifunctional inhibitor/plant lipid transfer protein/seed storage helical domain-containing protein n=2 Tax=Punica granatum TaxID=22663 RepID=A0A218VRC1_PUNGR|nr:putative lipid-transfer protein DIR1 [Punica granatum]OWM62748.1 hypothetical protein CDL15_Pgr020042 [Punica granatum]PKI59162.1 hypothetical protein CRG98_020427 [Punica granatum]
MAAKLVVLVVVFVAVAAVEATSRGNNNGVSLCKMNEDGLTACKPSVTKPNPVDPTPECCKALSAADLNCLCSYRNSLMLPALGIDPELAMGLPAKCSLPVPSGCSAMKHP